MADLPIRDFKMSATNGWAVENGDFSAIGGAAAVPQGAAIRARMFKGENFIDETQGVDYQGKILSIKNPDPLIVRDEIGSNIAETPDVTDVVGSSLVGPDADRNADIDFQLATVYSKDPVTGTTSVTLP